MKHYKYGGSSAARTLACPGWVKLAEKVPQGDSSPWAEEGTALHDCMERILEESLTPGDFLGKTINAVPITEGHVELLEMALVAWDELCTRYGIVDYVTELSVERDAETGGTMDVLAWSADRALVVDWKFGQGVAVRPESNAQGLFYHSLSNTGHPEIADKPYRSFVIIQPMPSRDEPTLKVWDFDPDKVTMFNFEFEAARRNDTLHSGPHCQFCPGAAICPVRTGEADAALVMDPANLTTLRENLERAWQLKAWCKEVETLAHQQMEQGADLDGFKLVNKRPTRRWTDEKAIRDVFSKMRRLKAADYLTEALKSPAQMEVVLKSKGVDPTEFDSYTESKSSGTTLALESDKRPAIIMNVNKLKQALNRS